MNRRSAISRLIITIGSFITATLAYMGIRFAVFKTSEPRTREIPAELVSGLIPNNPVHVLEAGVWLVKISEDLLYIFDDRCPHLGCRHKWNPDLHVFHCPCHGSEFDLNGTVLKGPAVKSLKIVGYKSTNSGKLELQI